MGVGLTSALLDCIMATNCGHGPINCGVTLGKQFPGYANERENHGLCMVPPHVCPCLLVAKASIYVLTLSCFALAGWVPRAPAFPPPLVTQPKNLARAPILDLRPECICCPWRSAQVAAAATGGGGGGGGSGSGSSSSGSSSVLLRLGPPLLDPHPPSLPLCKSFGLFATMPSSSCCLPRWPFLPDTSAMSAGGHLLLAASCATCRKESAALSLMPLCARAW